MCKFWSPPVRNAFPSSQRFGLALLRPCCLLTAVRARVPARISLPLRIGRVCLDLTDLQDVPLRVRRDHQEPLIQVHIAFE